MMYNHDVHSMYGGKAGRTEQCATGQVVWGWEAVVLSRSILQEKG